MLFITLGRLCRRKDANIFDIGAEKQCNERTTAVFTLLKRLKTYKQNIQNVQCLLSARTDLVFSRCIFHIPSHIL